jgi:hypothetical protein
MGPPEPSARSTRAEKGAEEMGCGAGRPALARVVLRISRTVLMAEVSVSSMSPTRVASGCGAAAAWPAGGARGRRGDV